MKFILIALTPTLMILWVVFFVQLEAEKELLPSPIGVLLAFLPILFLFGIAAAINLT